MEKQKNNIALEIEKVIRENEDKFDIQELKEFEIAIREFDKLIEKGLVKKRGYTLITIDQKHLKNAQYSSNY